MTIFRPGHLYLMPNAFGLLWLVGVIWIFVLTFIIDSILVNVAGFSLFSFFLIGLFQANDNLKSVVIKRFIIFPVSAGSSLGVELSLENTGQDPAFAVLCRIEQVKSIMDILPAQETRSLILMLPASARGVYKLPELALASRFPNGLFTAWQRVQIEGRYAVYPAPSGNLPIPRIAASGTPVQRLRWEADADFAGHRPYLETDSQQHVDWKARARGLPLLIKTFTESEQPDVILDETQLSGLDIETRLSQLSRWVMDCEARKTAYSLTVDSVQIPRGLGPLQASKCFWALASAYGGDSSA